MQILLNLLFVAALTLTSTMVSAGALCPPNSCNIHNGCMEGCKVNMAIGGAACNSEDPYTAGMEALKSAVSFAHTSCLHSFFLTSDWKVNQVENADSCEVTAQATFSCYQ